MRLLTSSWILPVAGPPIREGRVAVAEGRVAWLGRRTTPGAPAAPVEDLGPGVILPGLVNAHCHLELSYLQGRIALPQPFVPWVRALVAARARETPNVLRAGAERGIQQLVGGGTVAVGDVSNGLAHLDLFAASGLRAVVFLELIGWDPERADAVLRAADAGLAALPPEWEAGGVSVRIAAHAPHSVSPALFRRLVERGGPAAVHLAESPSERAFLREGDESGPSSCGRGPRPRRLPTARPGSGSLPRFPGRAAPGSARGPLRADRCGRPCAAGGARRLRGALPAQQPQPRAGPAARSFHAGGGRAALPGQRRAGERRHAGRARRRATAAPGVSGAGAHELLRMATLGGAQALGLAELGSIEAGKRAALVHARGRGPIADPLEHVFSPDTPCAGYRSERGRRRARCTGA